MRGNDAMHGGSEAAWRGEAGGGVSLARGTPSRMRLWVKKRAACGAMPRRLFCTFAQVQILM